MNTSPTRRPRSGRPAEVDSSDTDGVRLIKKYSNRKLYDTTSRQYITLDRIGHLVHDGESIRVIDRTSGEDLTAVTLSQVVLERERKRHGAVPEQLLQQLVRAPGEAVSQAVRQSIAVGQDFLQRAEERVVRAPEAAIEETLLRTLRSLKIPTQQDLAGFDRRLKDLARTVEELAAAIGHTPSEAAPAGASRKRATMTRTSTSTPAEPARPPGRGRSASPRKGGSSS